ncbi:MAG: glycine cleavage system protein GcvH [Armatimonadota bacterium]
MAMDAYRFSEGHSWAKEDDGEFIVGITEYAANELGDIIFVELPDVGTSVSSGEAFGSVESAKAVEDLIAPLSGEVTRINEDIIDMPEILNEDPYEEGWLITIEASDEDELASLLTHDQYQSNLEMEDEPDVNMDDEDFFNSQ